jgi:drug/metabolite transporter superfamily protein YnfA
MNKQEQPTEFEKAAVSQAKGGFMSDLWGFLKTNKKWWLLPILIVFLIFGVLILLSSTGVAPFIYTLF